MTCATLGSAKTNAKTNAKTTLTLKHSNMLTCLETIKSKRHHLFRTSVRHLSVSLCKLQKTKVVLVQHVLHHGLT